MGPLEEMKRPGRLSIHLQLSTKGVGLLLNRLASVNEIDGRWTAKCPLHDDLWDSLRISHSARGKLLISCDEGCSPADVLAAIGLELADLLAADSSLPTRDQLCAELGIPVAVNDAQRETLIDNLAIRFRCAPRSESPCWWELMRQEIAQRSPEQIRRIEIAKGLRAA